MVTYKFFFRSLFTEGQEGEMVIQCPSLDRMLAVRKLPIWNVTDTISYLLQGVKLLELQITSWERLVKAKNSIEISVF